ncbi:MAG: hypothetical protein CR991_04445 [Proteobacteria bacterium]|nr:MAG: hypothetical protein CR991_04445 [Pseudomonadota bacterium]
MFKKVIFPIDLEDLGSIEPHLKEIEKIIRYTQAELRVVTVLPGYTMPIISSYLSADIVSKAKQNAAQELKNFMDQQLASDIKLSSHIREGRPHEQILAEAKEWQADLIVMPSHIKSKFSTHIGSVAQRVSERAKCSVLILRA